MAFPNFDFKIDCGDDPAVRQWLHDNGCIFSYLGKTISDIKADEKYLCCDIEDKIVLTFDPNNLGLISHYAKHINPFDYIQSEPTVADRMAALIEEHKDKIPTVANYVAVDSDGRIYAYEVAPKLGSGGSWISNQYGLTSLIGYITNPQHSVLCNVLWRETLTEIKPEVITQYYEDRKGKSERIEIADQNEAMIDRDERDYSKPELAHAQMQTRKHNLALFAKQDAKEIKTIPSTLPSEQAMPMMLGGEFGGEV